jgi:hypothetical protein
MTKLNVPQCSALTPLRNQTVCSVKPSKKLRTSKRLKRLVAIAALVVAPLTASIVVASPASADTTCHFYTETTGGCMTQWHDENGVFHSIMSFFWGNHWIDIRLS